jgi:hypothetical protein
MAANCFSWIIYGYVGLDWYIYFGNIPGLMFGMFYVLTCYKFSKEQVRLERPVDMTWLHAVASASQPAVCNISVFFFRLCNPSEC